jgi:hypothetical protein
VGGRGSASLLWGFKSVGGHQRGVVAYLHRTGIHVSNHIRWSELQGTCAGKHVSCLGTLCSSVEFFRDQKLTFNRASYLSHKIAMIIRCAEAATGIC